MTKSLNLRVIHTHDVEENWLKLLDFVPNSGELIVYDADTSHLYERFKIGDGVTNLHQLPFTTEAVMYSMFSVTDNIGYLDAGRITEYK